jgi:hypothetical protein
VAAGAAAVAVVADDAGVSRRRQRLRQRHQKPAGRPKLLLRRDDKPAADRGIRAAGAVAADAAGDRRRGQRRLLSGRNTRRSGFNRR